MQYFPSKWDECTDKKGRGNQPHIRDYRDYYWGFYSSLQPDKDQKFYIPAKTLKKTPSNLFVILFDSNAAKKKKQKIYWKTTEMLVVNFNCLAAIPMFDTAVVYPFDLFLQCADADKTYKEIVQRAIAWREEYITNNYMGGFAV